MPRKRHRHAGTAASLRPETGLPRASGFTLVELIVTISVVSVLAVVALPRLGNITGFDSQGYMDHTRSLVRFAQKAAISRRHPVFVEFNGGDNTFKICSTPNDTSCSCAAAMTLPTAIRARPSGVTLSATTDAFCFDSSGRPLQTSMASAALNTVTVIGDATRTYIVEAETGFTH
jgi:MSHA pilin protein MshC